MTTVPAFDHFTFGDRVKRRNIIATIGIECDRNCNQQPIFETNRITHQLNLSIVSEIVANIEWVCNDLGEIWKAALKIVGMAIFRVNLCGSRYFYAACVQFHIERSIDGLYRKPS